MKELIADLVKWMESESGPLERAWENCDIGFFEDVQWDFDETLRAIRGSTESVAGYDEPKCVKLYRRLLALIDREGDRNEQN